MSIKVLKKIVEQEGEVDGVIKAGDVNINKFLEEVRKEDAKWDVKQWSDQQIEGTKISVKVSASIDFLITRRRR
jgi:hypothetical protein